MTISTNKNFLRNKVWRKVFIALAFVLFSLSGQAQLRKYSLIYSENIKGGTTMFGNTLLHAKKQNNKGFELPEVDLVKMNNNSINGNSLTGNDNEYMRYIDIDGNTGNGRVTFNSSSADLILPSGTNTIKFARLYWGGRYR